jgi:hypothetical protein
MSGNRPANYRNAYQPFAIRRANGELGTLHRLVVPVKVGNKLVSFSQ